MYLVHKLLVLPFRLKALYHLADRIVTVQSCLNCNFCFLWYDQAISVCNFPTCCSLVYKLIWHWFAFTIYKLALPLLLVVNTHVGLIFLWQNLLNIKFLRWYSCNTLFKFLRWCNNLFRFFLFLELTPILNPSVFKSVKGFLKLES